MRLVTCSTAYAVQNAPSFCACAKLPLNFLHIVIDASLHKFIFRDLYNAFEFLVTGTTRTVPLPGRFTGLPYASHMSEAMQAEQCKLKAQQGHICKR